MLFQLKMKKRNISSEHIFLVYDCSQLSWASTLSTSLPWFPSRLFFSIHVAFPKPPKPQNSCVRNQHKTKVICSETHVKNRVLKNVQ